MIGKNDTYSRTYTPSEVAKIVGMNIETLRVWRRRKQLCLRASAKVGPCIPLMI
ncbi:MerR family transcriptional regulator [Pseudovibrio sp. W64]|uniref:MerR family transcriptional regulator n=1 Tax=Pseudovibrio sp. W64 TaxID=1735583 RepID=UPI001AD93F69